MSETKRCPRCRRTKPATAFFRRSGAQRHLLSSWCRACFRLHLRRDPSRTRERNRLSYQRWKPVWWREVLTKLGGRCACCGEAEELFLTVDHINRDADKNRRKLWLDVRQSGFDRSRFRILCFNCNQGRERTSDKRCPHEYAKERLKLRIA